MTMTTRFFASAALAVTLPLLSQARAADVADALKKEVVANYATIASLTTADAHAQALELQTALAAFTAAPSKETHDKAKDAWIAARLPYLQAEVFRVADPDGAVLDSPRVETLTKAQEKPGGFPVIEFLLWGKDGSVDGPGERAFDDYLVDKSDDAVRLSGLLKASSELVVSKTAASAAAWGRDPAGDTRAKLLEAPVDQSLKTILGNVSTLAGTRLGKERIGVPYKSRDQADESSNFSDATHLDLIYVCSGLANVVAGAYVGGDKEVKVQGTGLLKLASALGEKQAGDMQLAINRVMLAVTSFRPPFDRALLAPDDSPAREAIKEIMDALDELTMATGELAKGLGIEL